MATNLKQGKGLVIQHTNVSGSDIESNDAVLLGDQGLKGLALEDIANGASGSVMVPPGFIISHSVLGHDGTANAAVAIYDKVFFTAGEAFFDVDAAATFMGYTLGATASGATETENVLIAPAIA